MLIGKFRDGLKSKFTQYFLFFMCAALVFGVGFLKVMQRIITGRTGQEIAFVNKVGIEHSAFILRKYEKQEQLNDYYRKYGQYAPFVMEQHGINPDPEKSALSSLIQEQLIDQATASFPIYIDRSFVEYKIHDPVFMYKYFSYMLPDQFVAADGKIDIEGYQAFIQSLPQAKLIEEVTHKFKAQMMMELVNEGMYLPQFFVDSLMKLQNSEKKYDIYTILLDDVKKEVSKKEASPEALHKFYEQENRKNNRYFVQPKRSGVLWTFDPKHFSITVTDKELEDYYNKVKQSQFITKPTEVKIREIIFDQVTEKGLKQLYKEAQEVEKLLQEHPENFEQYARQYSTAKSASHGGLVDFFKRGTKEKSLEQAAFRLKKDGDISPIVSLEKGYAIIQRVARKETEYKSFESVKKEITTLLQQRKFSSQFTAQANRIIRSKSDTAEQDYENFLKSHNAVESTIAALEKHEGPIAGRLFSLKKSGDKLVYCADGKGYILVLKDILKKAELPFEVIHSHVAQDYYTHQAERSLENTIKELKSTIANGEKLTNPLVKKTTTSWIKNEKDEDFKSLHKDGINPEMLLCEKKGSLVSGTTDKKGYIVVLTDVRPSNVTEEEDAKLKKNINHTFHMIGQEAFIASLYRNAKIEMLLGQAGTTNPGDAYDFQI